MSTSSKVGGSRASDEDARTSVKVGEYRSNPRFSLRDNAAINSETNTCVKLSASDHHSSLQIQDTI